MPNEPVKTTSSAVATRSADPWSAWLGDYAGPTRDAYRRDLTQWQEFCDLESVDYLAPLPGHVTQWIDELRAAGRSAATIARKVATLASFYRWARHNQISTADP